MWIVAGDARDITFLETFAAHQADGLVADVYRSVGVAFGLVAMASGAELYETPRAEARGGRDRAGSFRVFPRTLMTAFAGDGWGEGGIVGQATGGVAAEAARRFGGIERSAQCGL